MFSRTFFPVLEREQCLKGCKRERERGSEISGMEQRGLSELDQRALAGKSEVPRIL